VGKEDSRGKGQEEDVEPPAQNRSGGLLECSCRERRVGSIEQVFHGFWAGPDDRGRGKLWRDSRKRAEVRKALARSAFPLLLNCSFSSSSSRLICFTG